MFSVQVILSFPFPPFLFPPKLFFELSNPSFNTAGELFTQLSRGFSPLADMARLNLHGSYAEPQFMMDRNVKIAVELWHEWTVGSGGKAAVEKLDRESGSAWRLKDKSQYHRRKQLIDEIKTRLERTPFRDLFEVVHELNDIQKAGHYTLNWMYETWLAKLKKEKKAAKTAEAAAV